MTKRQMVYHLRRWRLQYGMTLEEASRLFGITKVTLSNLETGKSRPSRVLARRIYESCEGEVPLAAIYDPDYYMQLTSTNDGDR